MKNFLLTAALSLICTISFSQVFWTETFGTGCNQGQPAAGLNAGGNGAWTVTNTGTNQASANDWFVSAMEAGMGAGNCGDGCMNNCAPGLTNRTLHISSTFTGFVDVGAAYLAGSSSNTDKRAESPVINCTGQSNITLSFNYLTHGIPGTDYSEVHYFNGTTWSTIGTLAPTSLCTDCNAASQGVWSATPFSVTLPASANNNANVKIGFRWVNTDPTGSDPSVAIDDITLSASTTPTSAISFTLPSPVCELATITTAFTSTVPTTYSWTASSANVVFTPPNSGTTTISFTGPGTYTVFLTATQGTASATGSATIQVLPTPTVNVTATPTVICGSGSSTLTATGGTTYTWTASTGPNPPNNATVVVSPTVSTTYTVLTSIPGCTSGVYFTIPVVSQPTITVTPNSGICSGQSINLTASGGSTYTWSPPGSTSPTTGPSVTASPTVTTTYTVVGSNGTCTNSAVTTVTVGSAATVTVAPTNTTICSGQSAVLQASGGSTYTWTASSGANPPGVATVTVSPTTPTTYTVLTGSGTCTASAVTSVSVALAMSLTVTPTSTTICSGGAGVAITASGASTYSWSPGTGLSTTSGPNVMANPAATTNYTVSGSNGACTVTAVASVSVTSVALTVSPTTATYCAGGAPIVISASGAATASSYTWTPVAGLNTTSNGTVSASPAVTTTYSVVGNIGSCTSTKTVEITVTPPTTVSVVSTGTNICLGASGSTITASGAATYTWVPGTGLSSTTAPVVVANPATTTTYTVAGLTGAGCVVFPTVITVSVMPAVSPTITAASNTACVGTPLPLSAAPTGGSYTWTPAAAIQGSANTATINALATNTNIIIYTVTVSNGQCSGSQTYTITPFNCIPPIAGFTTSSGDSICVGGCVTFSNTSVSTSTNTTYSWIFPGGTPPTSTAANPQVCYSAPGDYTVALAVKNPFGSDTLVKNNYVDVAITPTIVAYGDTTIKLAHSTTIHASGGIIYNWSPSAGLACPTCSVTSATPTVTTMYIVTGYGTSPYCKSTDTVIVKVDFICPDFFIPNAFSPNNDGLNDYVNVHGFCVGSFTFQIFDRWGEKVFETSDKSLSWDGSYRGKPMDTGVFVYRCDGITIDGKTFNLKGNITLLR